jgi:hypothetical protein
MTSVETQVFVVMSDLESCNNPMGIYDDYEKAKSYADELKLKDIQARVCKYNINEKINCHGNTMQRVYENGLFDENKLFNNIIMHTSF